MFHYSDGFLASPKFDKPTSMTSDPDGITVIDGLDVEITPPKNDGFDAATVDKGKKSKDSRSMKLFKIALAEFVKDVLKPSWKQGNMSKETFKTIVKNIVDEVSGAMQSYQIPKSPGDINQYIESSQRKLTKCVMGHVGKYVEA
ncbi:zinc finger CCCH domain-containing protein 38-like [Tasmannia lanceolata]|uniref:zinc finger CCCH domain-containing protein 38-like n=1 Tax=Tasmannia lanceolata TaxID=3420 RepID=UPI004064062C